MEITLPAELENKLLLLAAEQGRDSNALIVEAIESLIDPSVIYNEPFFAGVEKGIAAADRGDFIEEDEMDARVAKMLQR